MARCRCNNLFVNLLTHVSIGGLNRLMASDNTRKIVVGAVYMTLVDVLVLIKSGFFAVLDCSSFDKSLAFGIWWDDVCGGS